jgi:FkbM family methyltransferase
MPFAEGYKGDAKAPLSSKVIGYAMTCTAFSCCAIDAPRLAAWEVHSLKNVVLHHGAVADQCGIVQFYTSSSYNLGLSSMRNLGQDATKAEIPSITIDSMMANLPSIRLVKIDVEGAELIVLKGMHRLIERDNPYIILELSNSFLQQMGSDVVMVCDFLASCHYSLYRVYGEKLQRIDIPPTGQCNVLALHKTMALQYGKIIEIYQPL